MHTHVSDYDLLQHFTQGVRETSQTSVDLDLSRATATQPDVPSASPTSGPVKLTFVYPKEGMYRKRLLQPILFLQQTVL